MIFVTVGMHYQGFERLIKMMDEIALELDEKVVMQIGHTKYEPINADWFRFIKKDEVIKDLINKSRLIIAHGGAGTILTILLERKPMIIVPRLKKFEEHFDDQQIELAEVLVNFNGVSVIYDVDYLKEEITRLGKNTNIHFEIRADLIHYLRRTVGE